LAEIAQSFSRFGAPEGYGEAALTDVDVARVVDEVMTLYRASDGPVGFSADVVPGLQPVRSRVPEMKEVLVNLLENARAASAPGSSVEVEATASEDGGVVLAIQDHGTGIPAAFMPRVFEPHFSTRSTGTGLGLAIVRRLVESWGGDVHLASAEGQGTRVTVHLRPWRAGPETVG
jgi:signal transduction histidine kinase